MRGVKEFGSVNTSWSIVPKGKNRVGCDVVADVIPARTVIAVDRGRLRGTGYRRIRKVSGKKRSVN